MICGNAPIQLARSFPFFDLYTSEKRCMTLLKVIRVLRPRRFHKIQLTVARAYRFAARCDSLVRDCQRLGTFFQRGKCRANFEAVRYNAIHS